MVGVEDTSATRGDREIRVAHLNILALVVLADPRAGDGA